MGEHGDSIQSQKPVMHTGYLREVKVDKSDKAKKEAKAKLSKMLSKYKNKDLPNGGGHNVPAGTQSSPNHVEQQLQQGRKELEQFNKQYGTHFGE